ncbi:MAG TPA: hypothetical protein DD383_00995 [Rikenellaceae bacterium]|nr:hypothetical protein [Rikenellaceae bacterium]HCQ71952.1 hypothetical protein [Rikenellaceae bacterium]
MKKIIYSLMLVLPFLASCEGTWVMYDTAQKDHIYFQDRIQTIMKSFALLSQDEIDVTANVFVMGNVSDVDRPFKVESVDTPEGTVLTFGDVEYPVISAREGIDFEVEDCVIPAGEVSTTINVKLKRQPEMKDGGYVGVHLRLVPFENFEPLPADTVSSTVMSPDLLIYVNDGDPACPTWWRPSASKPAGWDYDLGNFYPAKFRKLLELYHQTAETNPTFYEYCVAHYGENLDAEPNADNNKMVRFWRQTYMAAWATYVFCPLYEYYEQYYKEHPDDPNFEVMGTDNVNINAFKGWGDPRSGKYGFLN